MRAGALFFFLMCWGHATSQVDYPYNPDSNGDSLIGISDLIDMLATFGGPFQPAPITLEDEPLESILTTLIQQVNALQTQVADLESEVVSKDSIIALTWGKSFVNADLSGATFIDANLSYADFTGADLSGANLTDSYFYLASLDLSNLSEANLTNTDLFQASLMSADLTGANLSFALLGEADLSGASVAGADFFDTYLNGAILNCLEGCPMNLPNGYACVPDETCGEAERFKIE